jgi:hypothetical protein
VGRWPRIIIIIPKVKSINKALELVNVQGLFIKSK